MTRRDLLTMALLAGSEKTLPGGIFKTDSRLQLGIQTYSLNHMPLEHTADVIGDLGLCCVEIFNGHLPLDSHPSYIRYIKRNFQKRDVKPLAYGVTDFDGNAKLNRAKFEFGKTLGLISFSADPSQEAFDNLEKLVDEYKINIAIHPHGPGSRYPGWRSVWKAVRGRHKRLGLCLDTGHVVRAGEDLVEGLQILSDRIFGVHLKDVDQNGRGVVLGKGIIDIPAIVKILRKIRFGGVLALEYEPEPSVDPLLGITKSLAYLRQIIS